MVDVLGFDLLWWSGNHPVDFAGDSPSCGVVYSSVLFVTREVVEI